MKKIYELQPLRIQSGWKIEFNNFTEYDLMLHDKSEAFNYLIEDLLQLSFCCADNPTKIIIDLGWYPNRDITGGYELVMIKDFNWSSPLETLTTKSKSDIISRLEYWVCYGFFSKYL